MNEVVHKMYIKSLYTLCWMRPKFYKAIVERSKGNVISCEILYPQVKTTTCSGGRFLPAPRAGPSSPCRALGEQPSMAHKPVSPDYSSQQPHSNTIQPAPVQPAQRQRRSATLLTETETQTHLNGGS